MVLRGEQRAGKRLGSAKGPTVMAQPMGILETVMPTAPVKAVNVGPKVPFPRSLHGSLAL